MPVDMRSRALYQLGQGKGSSQDVKAEGMFYRSLLDRVGVDYSEKMAEAFAELPFEQRPPAGVCLERGKMRVDLLQERFDKLTLEEAIGTLAHEARHIFQNTPRRMMGKDHKLYNFASDLVINEALLDSGYTLPKEGVTVASLKKAASDPEADPACQKLYDLVRKNFKVHDTTEEEVYRWVKSVCKEVPQPFQEDCEGGTGDIGDGAAESDASVKVKIAGAAIQASKVAGDKPAWLDRMVESYLVEKPAWPDVIRDWMMSFSDSDLSWQKPDGIILSNYKLFMPDFHSEAMEELVIVIDTSGSISEKILNDFASHISAGIAVVAPKKVHIVYCDAGINRTETLLSPTAVTLTPCGGGGTDFKPAMAWVKKNAPNADGLVYFTDGYGDFGQDPGFPVLWAIMEGCLPRDQIPYGRYVEIEQP